MKIKLRITISICALSLSACAVAPPVFDYVKEGASQHQKTDAISECQYQIKLNKTPVEQQKDLVELCMKGKGFRLKQVR